MCSFWKTGILFILGLSLFINYVLFISNRDINANDNRPGFELYSHVKRAFAGRDRRNAEESTSIQNDEIAAAQESAILSLVSDLVSETQTWRHETQFAEARKNLHESTERSVEEDNGDASGNMEGSALQETDPKSSFLESETYSDSAPLNTGGLEERLPFDIPSQEQTREQRHLSTHTDRATIDPQSLRLSMQRLNEIVLVGVQLSEDEVLMKRGMAFYTKCVDAQAKMRTLTLTQSRIMEFLFYLSEDTERLALERKNVASTHTRDVSASNMRGGGSGRVGVASTARRDFIARVAQILQRMELANAWISNLEEQFEVMLILLESLDSDSFALSFSSSIVAEEQKTILSRMKQVNSELLPRVLPFLFAHRPESIARVTRRQISAQSIRMPLEEIRARVSFTIAWLNGLSRNLTLFLNKHSEHRKNLALSVSATSQKGSEPHTNSRLSEDITQNGVSSFSYPSVSLPQLMEEFEDDPARFSFSTASNKDENIVTDVNVKEEDTEQEQKEEEEKVVVVVVHTLEDTPEHLYRDEKGVYRHDI